MRLNQTIPLELKKRSEAMPAASALLAPGRRALSYGELWTEINRHVRELFNFGLVGSRIAVVLPNGPEMAVAFLAVASTAAFAPLNPTFRSREFDFYLSDLEPGAIIVEKGVESPVTAVAASRHIPVIELTPEPQAPAGTFSLASAPSADSTPLSFAGPDDVALILHTSGTTSRPKIVPLTHANLSTSAGNVCRALRLNQDDRCLNVMPLFHIHGLIAGLLAPLYSGGSTACPPGFIAPRFFGWLDELKPTWYTAVPTMHQAVLARAPENAECIVQNPFRLIRSSSSPLPPRVMADLERAFAAPVIESYGMTEASHQMASNPLPPRPHKARSVGVAAGPEVAVVGPSGDLLPADQIGEVVIRGDNVMQGYLNNPEANETAFVDGWFRTGDEGYLDSEGYLFLTGRAKEMINRAGEKISPREIDEVLLEHPAVAQAVAFALPDLRLGEEIGAAVVLRPTMTATEVELRSHVAARVADFKVPSRIVFVEEIPKGPTGKIQRIGMADRLGLAAESGPQPQPESESIAPRTPIEQALARIWAEVLGVERFGVRDAFLALGGDSLLAGMLIARVRERMHVDISLLEFFEAPTIEEQARIVAEAQRTGIPRSGENSSLA